MTDKEDNAARPPEQLPLEPKPEDVPSAEASCTDCGARTWHLSVAYDGSDFRGWQIQPGQRTVQRELQSRLARLFRAPDLRTAATSRTDAGVHALAQQVSFSAVTPPELDAESIRCSLNRWLPRDIRVTRVREREPGFNARRRARAKAYTYVAFRGEKCNPLHARFVWHVPGALDADSACRAAALLAGEHDFASFGVNAKREVTSFVRTVHRLEVLPRGEFVFFNVVGDSFLYKMVRSLVGYLVHVGRGAAAPEDALTVLEAKDRCAAADSAPAQGLFLARVFFQAGEWETYQPILPPFAWHSAETPTVTDEPEKR